MKKSYPIFLGFVFLAAFSVPSVSAHDPPPPPRPAVSPTPLASAVLETALNRAGGPISRAQREKAYAKVLEGQRFLETAKRSLTKTEYDVNIRLAKQSFQNAVESDPSLSEA